MKRSKIPWTPLIESSDPTGYHAGRGEALFINSRYQVALKNTGVHEPFGQVIEMSVKRRDKQPIYDWRDMQKIKNELFHPEATAIQIFPSEKRLVDTANQYYFFVMEYEFPFGFKSRFLNGKPAHKSVFGDGVQRPFSEEHVPADLPEQQEHFNEQLKQAETLFSGR